MSDMLPIQRIPDEPVEPAEDDYEDLPPTAPGNVPDKVLGAMIA